MTNEDKAKTPIYLITSGEMPSEVLQHAKNVQVLSDTHYSETYGKPIADFLSNWCNKICDIRMFGGYRYQRVVIDIKMRKEKRNKPCPRFLRRVRGEEVFASRFHYDDYGEVYLPRRMKPIRIG